MLSTIRAFSKSWVALILFMLLLVSLIIWGGMGKMLDITTTTGVVSVGDHSVSPAEYERTFNGQLAAIGKQQGGPPPPREEAIKAGFHTRILQNLADQLSFAEALNKLGIVPSPHLFAEKIQEYQGFFDEITGQFDKKKYLELLKTNNVSQKGFEQSVRDTIAMDHLAAGIQAGLVAPRAYGALVAVSQLENRSWSSFIIDPSKVAKPAAPTDAQLTAFIAEVGRKRPETRELTFVRFSTKAIEGTMPVDPVELQKLYDFKKDTLSKPEMRSIVQIPVKNAGQAAQVATRLKAGEDPAAIAKSVGTEAINFVDKPKSAITDRKVADAAFALPANGAVSGAIQGDLGMAVVKVNEIKPALTVGLEQIKGDLEQQLRHDAAQKKVYAQVEAYEKAHDSGSKLPDAAKAVGATLVTTGELAANGATPSGQPPAGLSQKLMAKAFELSPGEESDTQDEGNGEYFVVRVDKVIPAALPKLADVREEAAKAYIQRETAKALKAKADELVARIKKGESFEAAAASVGASVNHAAAVDRTAAQKEAQAVGMELLTAVFQGAKGDVVATGAPTGIAVVRIDDVQPGALAQLAPIADASRRQANGELVTNLMESGQIQARKVLKPKIDTKKADQVLGITPEEAAAPKADTPPKKAKG